MDEAGNILLMCTLFGNFNQAGMVKAILPLDMG